jgi:hypothetical protein
MTVFFVSTPSTDSYETSVTQKISEALTHSGHGVSPEIEIDPDHDTFLIDGQKATFDSDKMTSKIKRADAFFAKLSRPSAEIGYLISIALQVGKPVILFVPASSGNNFFKVLEEENDKLQVIEYRENEPINKEVAMAIEYVHSSQDTRFNFFVSPDISTYLNWISKNRRIPRSVYLRELIDIDMKRTGNT